MSTPRWITPPIARMLHTTLLASHGGPTGVRDAGALASALGRSRQKHAYGETSLAALAAAYAFGISSNHPFVDGNKRTALAILDVFLRLNGASLEVTEAEAATAIVRLAAGRLEESELTEWVAANLEPL